MWNTEINSWHCWNLGLGFWNLLLVAWNLPYGTTCQCLCTRTGILTHVLLFSVFQSTILFFPQKSLRLKACGLRHEMSCSSVELFIVNTNTMPHCQSKLSFSPDISDLHGLSVQFKPYFLIENIRNDCPWGYLSVINWCNQLKLLNLYGLNIQDVQAG